MNDLGIYAKGLSEPPALHPGVPAPSGDPLKAIAKAKAMISDLKIELDGIDASPWPSSVVRAKVMADINAAAARGSRTRLPRLKRISP